MGAAGLVCGAGGPGTRPVIMVRAEARPQAEGSSRAALTKGAKGRRRPSRGWPPSQTSDNGGMEGKPWTG